MSATVTASSQPRQRTGRHEKWVDTPLTRMLRDALAVRRWTITELGREIGTAPSVISRWMQGGRPSVNSLRLLSDALGLDFDQLMVAADYRDDPLDSDDPRREALIAKLRLIDLTDERYAVLNAVLETFWRRRIEPRGGDGSTPRDA